MITIRRTSQISGEALTEQERNTLSEAAAIINDMAGCMTPTEVILGDEVDLGQAQLYLLELVFIQLSNGEVVDIGIDWDY